MNQSQISPTVRPSAPAVIAEQIRALQCALQDPQMGFTEDQRRINTNKLIGHAYSCYD